MPCVTERETVKLDANNNTPRHNSQVMRMKEPKKF